MKIMQAIGSGILMAAAAESGAFGGAPASNFGDDVAFLKKHTEVVVLSDKSGNAKVALAPKYQGRVMTSTGEGDKGLSFGWINRDFIAAGKLVEHMNAFGGEERFWMGPEGGQFSIFFAKGVPFKMEHWFTPAPIDTEPFKLVKQSKSSALFQHAFTLTNYSGTVFNLKVNRDVRLLDTKSAWAKLGCKPSSKLSMVAFESDNEITNAGKEAWKKDTGLLSIWILCMFNPSPATTVVVPIKTGPESELGKVVTSDYFGEVPADRLVVKDGAIYFSADGKYRSKIGISPKRTKGILGSYDAKNKVLTLAQFTHKEGVTDYVNSLWKIQDNPFGAPLASKASSATGITIFAGSRFFRPKCRRRCWRPIPIFIAGMSEALQRSQSAAECCRWVRWWTHRSAWALLSISLQSRTRAEWRDGLHRLVGKTTNSGMRRESSISLECAPTTSPRISGPSNCVAGR